MRISVVIPAFEAWATLPQVLDALGPQVVAPDREVILVESAVGQRGGEMAVGRPWLQVVSLPTQVLPGRARNLGAGRSAGDLLVFLDADTVPEPQWLDGLERSLGDRDDAVAGAVLNGTPWHPIGLAGYLLEFSEWLPAPRPDLVHGASCNLMIRRQAIEALGGFPEDVFPGEDTILTFRLAKAGRLAFAPKAGVRHLNRTGMGEFLRHQRRLGAAFGAVCRTVQFPHAVFARPMLVPLVVPLRLGALARRLVRSPTDAVKAIAVLPILILGLVAWAIGLAAGH